MNKVSIIDEKNLGKVSHELEYDSIHDLAAIVSTSNWAPGLFTTGKRKISDLSSIGLLVLDVDDGRTLAEALEDFKEYKHIIATSRSHQKEKNGKVCDRFRVILFLDSEVIDDKDFKATWQTAQRRWGYIDEACKDSSRFFYASPDIISISETGREYPVSIAQTIRTQPDVGGERLSDMGQVDKKGDLWKSTLDFLLNGAVPGTRHNRLISAVGNMREQGYSKAEVIDLITEMSERVGDPAFVDAHALRNIDDMYARELKYPYRPKEEGQSDSGVIVSASDLLDETFEYLADKDKVKGDPTGIEGLDRLLGGGFRTGELTVLMAQAKTGKNTLYHYLIYKHLERGLPFAYASRELNPATEVVPNLLTIALQSNLWTSDVSESLKERSRSILDQWRLYFAPGYGTFNPDDIETWFKACRDLGVTHFLFDHFHYALEGEDYEATARLIKRLKSLTKELDIHLSLIVQPRSLREGESLSLATLRGGAAIGQALDNLLILERVRGENNISRLKLDQARHKLATLGEVYLQYDKETTSFVEVERQLVSETPLAPRGIERRSWPSIQN